jgi:streptogramin lyase
VLYKGGTVEKHPLTGNAGLDSVQVGANPNDVFVGGSVWVANYGDGTVTRIDPISRESRRPSRSAATPHR